MKTRARAIAILAPVLLVLAAPVAAQSGGTPQPTPALQPVTVTGSVVNRSEGGAVPDSLDLVLHAWDEQFSERLMLDGQSEPDGTFRFEDVALEPGLLVNVMATYTYQGVSYFSTPVLAGDEDSLPAFEVPIYETTSDASQVQIGRMHVLFTFSHAGLEVAEVYSLSNTGDRTVKDAAALADGAPATFEFPLPEGATNVAFYPEAGSRFVRTSDGFADAAPLLPGENSGQVMVNYILPYTSGMTYAYTARLATRGLNFMYAEDAGVTVAGDGLAPTGVQQTGDGFKFAVLSGGPLQPGQTARVTLSGEPQVSVMPPAVTRTDAATASSSPSGVIVVAGIALGLGLVAVGAWWFRQSSQNTLAAAPAESEFEALLMQIALLDEARERGEVDETIYTSRRAALIEQARARLPA